MEKKTRKKSKILPILLILFIVAVILIICITSVITKKQNESKQEQINQAKQEFINDFNKPVNESTEKQNVTSNSSSTGITYQGFEVLGSIEIDSINLKYPILNEISAKAMDTAVCLSYGTLKNNENAVIVGDKTKFRNLKNVSINDEISIIDTKGITTNYVVYNKFITSSQDTSFYNRDTKGKNEITLSTQSDNIDDRLIVLAREK